MAERDLLLDVMVGCRGFYDAVDRASGQRVGPLVGYAGKYDTPEGPKHWVGEVYYNFAEVECRQAELDAFAQALASKMETDYQGLQSEGARPLIGVVGAPMGGLKLAGALARALGPAKLDIYPEKKITALATAGSREESKLVWGRHRPWEGSAYVIVEDVCNNFSTTYEMIGLIEEASAVVRSIVCAVNRSGLGEFEIPSNDPIPRVIPVIAALEIPTEQWRQDDPHVAETVEAGEVVWKPKDVWWSLVKNRYWPDTIPGA